MEECLKWLIDAVVDPSTKEFNLDIFYGNQVDGGKIIDAANAYPMLADSRMVVVKEVQKLSASSLEAVAKYIEKPSVTTKLVLICDKLNVRGKSFLKIKSKSCYVEFKPLYDSKIPGWIRDYLSDKGLDISYDASLLVQAYVGNNLRAIVNELDKITLNLNDKKKIEEIDVQNVVGLSRKFSVFNLNDAIGNKEIEKSLVILNKMLESGESHTGILAMITRHFVNLLKIKSCLARNKNENEISSMTGIPPFFIKKSKAMAQNYSFGQFQRIFDCLLATDLSLKTSMQSPKIALQTMLLQILR